MDDAPETTDRCRPDGGRPGASCDDCGADVVDALARTVSVSVDRSEVDSHRLCPDCFADWIARYEAELVPTETGDEDSEIIVD